MNEIHLAGFETAIREMHGCASRLVGPERVIETHDGQVVWEGGVLVFQLAGHPTATLCYVWEVDGEVTAVLHEGPVDSPAAAVRAAIMSEEITGNA